MNKVLLTAEEAADALSIGRTKVYELLASGLLRSVQIGKSRRIPVSAIHEFVDRLAPEGDETTGPILLEHVVVDVRDNETVESIERGEVVRLRGVPWTPVEIARQAPNDPL